MHVKDGVFHRRFGHSAQLSSTHTYRIKGHNTTLYTYIYIYIYFFNAATRAAKGEIGVGGECDVPRSQ